MFNRQNCPYKCRVNNNYVALKGRQNAVNAVIRLKGTYD